MASIANAIASSQSIRSTSPQLKEKMKRAFNYTKHLYGGISQDAYTLIERFHCEVFEHRHRYCKELSLFFAIWKTSPAQDNFDTWMHKLDLGQDVPGKADLKHANLLQVDGKPIEIPSMQYLTPAELSDYEVVVDNQGQMTTKNNGYQPFHNEDSSKETAYIFIITPYKKIYIGRYVRGKFGHTSFGGGAVKCAGALIFKNGKLTIFWDDSGHYNSEAYRSKDYGSIRKRMLNGLREFKKQNIDTSETVVYLTECVGADKVINQIPADQFLSTNP